MLILKTQLCYSFYLVGIWHQFRELKRVFFAGVNTHLNFDVYVHVWVKSTSCKVKSPVELLPRNMDTDHQWKKTILDPRSSILNLHRPQPRKLDLLPQKWRLHNGDFRAQKVLWLLLLSAPSGNAKRYSRWFPRIGEILHSSDLLSANETGLLAKLTTPPRIKFPCLASPL